MVARKVKRKKKRTIDKVSTFVVWLTAIASVALVISILYLGFIPEKYVLLLVGSLLVFNLFFAFLGLSKRINNLNKGIQIFICSILSIALITGSILIPQYKSRIENIFIGLQDITELKISLYTLKEDEKTEIAQFSGSRVGVHATFDKEHQNIAIADINRLIEDDLIIDEYTNIFEVVDSLYNGNNDAILLNETYVNLIMDNDDYKDFLDRTRVAYTVTQEVANSHSSGFTGVVTKSPFTILIGGEDTYDYSNIGTDDDGIAKAGNRTDVNIMVVVNPNTKQILLVTIPRDAYVPMMGDTNAMDKLTHASVISIDNWINCVEGIFDNEFDVNFFYRVNFGSLVKVVNALGGIEVDNPYAFQSIYHQVYENGWLVNRSYWYPEGLISMDGNHALLYVRERFNLPNGDEDRNKNTARVLKAIIKKATSAEVISNADELLEEMAGTFVTDMSFKQLSSLIKMQVNDMAEWDIVTKSLSGTADWGYSYLLGYDRMMSYLNQESIDQIKTVVNQVLESKVIE